MSLQLAPERLAEFVRGIPKAELHIHIEGSLEPELIFALAQRNGVSIPYPSVEALRAAYAFTNLQSFLDIYYAGASVLLKEQDFSDMAWAYFQRAHADRVTRAELFFDPQTHTDRGVPFATMIDGLRSACDRARRELGIEAELILCFLRHLDEAAAFATLEEARPHLGKFIGVGLDSSEVGHPPEKFARVFADARKLGLRAVAHAAQALGGLDGVVHCAGIVKYEPVGTLTPQALEAMWRVNQLAPTLLSQEAARVMVQQGHGGSIVTVSSTATRWRGESSVRPSVPCKKA